MEIQAEGVCIQLGGKTIVEDIALQAKKGQFIGVIGPNGSGKSTFLKAVYRVLKPDSGWITLNGVCHNTLSHRETAQKMAVLTQHNYYNFDFTVLEVVLMGRTPHKKTFERDNEIDYAIVNEALEKVEMLAFKERIFSTLSGGEQQRILLARALAQQTDSLILDEPTNHLDIKHQLQIITLAKKLGVTVIAALHDLNIAAAYSDYLYVLKDGCVVAKGEPERVLTPSLIHEVYDVRAKVTPSDGEWPMTIAYDMRG